MYVFTLIEYFMHQSNDHVHLFKKMMNIFTHNYYADRLSSCRVNNNKQ